MTHEPGAACPPEILAAIPWYPDELAREEREAVDSHAAACGDCRRELEARLGEGDEEAMSGEAEALFTRVMSQIEVDEAENLREWARAPRRQRAVRWLREREVRVPGTAASVSLYRGLPAVASFGALVAAAALFIAGPQAPAPAETSAPAAIEQSALILDVVFRDATTAAQIASALDAIGGEIIAGPSPRGRYQIRLAGGADPDAAAQQLADAGIVVYAEPHQP